MAKDLRKSAFIREYRQSVFVSGICDQKTSPLSLCAQHLSCCYFSWKKALPAGSKYPIWYPHSVVTAGARRFWRTRVSFGGRASTKWSGPPPLKNSIFPSFGLCAHYSDFMLFRVHIGLFAPVADANRTVGKLTCS